MTARMHQVRFTIEQRERIRTQARDAGTTMEAHIAQAANTIAQVVTPLPEPPEDPRYVTSKVVIDDDVWDRLVLIARDRNLSVSELIATTAA